MHWALRLARYHGLALIVIFLAACAGSPTRESTGEYVDDTLITTKVKAKLLEDKQVSALRINVETFKGTVQLSGFANTSQEKQRAVELARSVPGVKAVKDNIVVK
jgi:osmotically-inducible protein OsmY